VLAGPACQRPSLHYLALSQCLSHSAIATGPCCCLAPPVSRSHADRGAGPPSLFLLPPPHRRAHVNPPFPPLGPCHRAIFVQNERRSPSVLLSPFSSRSRPSSSSYPTSLPPTRPPHRLLPPETPLPLWFPSECHRPLPSLSLSFPNWGHPHLSLPSPQLPELADDTTAQPAFQSITRCRPPCAVGWGRGPDLKLSIVHLF
jgi:hypothetical protein